MTEKSDSLSEKAGETYGYIKYYIEQKIEYYRLTFVERLSLTLSSLLTAFTLVILGSMVLLFGTLAIAFYLSRLLNSEGHGFLIVALFYLLLGIVIYFFRRRLIMEPIIQILVESLEAEEDRHDEEDQKPQP